MVTGVVTANIDSTTYSDEVVEIADFGRRRKTGGHSRVTGHGDAEAVLLGLLGGAVGVALGAASPAVYAYTKGWATVIPTEAWAGGFAASLMIGAVAGLMPARRKGLSPRLERRRARATCTWRLISTTSP
jgi:hypothetical protein